MIYYKARCDVMDRTSNYELITNELLTKCEKDRYFPSLPDTCFDVVKVKKTDTFTMFGARFIAHGKVAEII